MKSFKFSLLFSVLLLTACLGKDSNDEDREGLKKVKNITGEYSFITSAISYSCTHGFSGTSPAMLTSTKITHTDNEIEFYNFEKFPAENILLHPTKNITGVIEPSGKFTMTHSAPITITDTPALGLREVTINIEGYFNDSGWDGTYRYTLFLRDLKESCEYETTFEGYKQ